ncbi:putative Transmembrane protein [Quillaja saponaria]|uniref:Transmembrane protein n=1 Tax=Quillaja saponaria TaxID=32244 RepID=A0AAD7PTM5_QUISA|nr:putative Transmembrane protein [Quillaja saponaria]
MNHNEIQKLQTADKFKKYSQFLKRNLQFFISISLFSLLFWYSSGFSFCPHLFNAYFSTYLLSVFTHTFERKYMFLICNGILAFLTKTSVFSAPYGSGIPVSDKSDINKAPESRETVPVKSFGSSENVPSIAEEEEVEDYNYKGEEVSAESEDHQEDSTSCMETERENEAPIVEKEDDDVMVKQGDEVGTQVTANEELANTDELNRKIEEFIRKMKEEITIEAQTQLIAV